MFKSFGAAKTKSHGPPQPLENLTVFGLSVFDLLAKPCTHPYKVKTEADTSISKKLHKIHQTLQKKI